MRLLMTAFTLVNVHFSDSPNPTQTIQLKRTASGTPELTIRSRPDPVRVKNDRKELRKLLSLLIKLKIIPMKVSTPKNGASIHYAGTVPMTEKTQSYSCDRDGRLWGAPHVYIGDSASWQFLPAKGLTFTIMANARRVADRLSKGLNA
jgi:choline dehydrogenase-like flavoprotein